MKPIDVENLDELSALIQDHVQSENPDHPKNPNQWTRRGAPGEVIRILYRRRKCAASESAYEAKRQKELGFLKCRELEFLMIDPDTVPPHKAAFIRRKQEEIMKNIQAPNI
ncbi:hypothetical protein OROGR_022060 [Orobanche gracilis]